jgi:hypothetical protein
MDLFLEARAKRNSEPHQWKRYFNMSVLQAIALKGVAVLGAIGREIHHQFKFQDEDERWPTYCRKMTEYWSNLNNEVTGSDGEEDSLTSGQILDESETDVIIREPTKTKRGLSLEESDVDGMEEEESVTSEKSVRCLLGWGVLEEDDDEDSVVCMKKTKRRFVLEDSDGDGFEEEESVTTENSKKDDDEDSVVCATKTKRRLVLEESDGDGFEDGESVTSENSEKSAQFLGWGVLEEDDDEDSVCTTKKRRMLLESDDS